MSLDSYLGLGETTVLGSHTFTAEEIKQFARQYDPHPFHLDEESGRQSVFGGLCASGWHTAAMWMRYNLMSEQQAKWTGPGPKPEFGPSPGFTDLKWLAPVYAGDTITYTRRTLSHRALASRPGWRLLTTRAGATNQDGKAVLEFESTVLFRTG